MCIQVFPPDRSCAEVNLPASKSISNRVLILNALSYSPYVIENLSDCDDTCVMVRALESNDTCFDIHAAGTAMRFMTAFLSKIVGEWVLTGSERMKQRPIKLLVDALCSLGAKIEYLEKEGFPPLKIYGSVLEGGKLSLNGNVSSQYISALLMIAPYMRKGLELHLIGNIVSKPYIHMTLQLMKAYGVEAQWQGNIIIVQPGEYRPIPFKIESDWSAASYWYEIAALLPGSEFELEGLRKNSVQGDSKIAEYFFSLGISTQYTDSGVKIKYNGNMCRKMVCDLTDQPDLAQTLIVTCALKEIPFRFSGLQSLKIKETDRIEALKNELKKLGYLITDINDSILEWSGERCEAESEPIIETYDDHRMAMAFAPVSITRGSIIIRNPKVVNKSYPSYWKDIENAGFKIKDI